MSVDSVTLRHSVYFQDLTDATYYWCTLCLPGPMKRIKNSATTSFSALLTHAKSHGVGGNWKALIAPAAPGHAVVYEEAKNAHAAAAGRVVTAAAKRPKQQTTLVTRMCAFASRESVARVFCTTPIAFVILRQYPEVMNFTKRCDMQDWRHARRHRHCSLSGPSCLPRNTQRSAPLRGWR